ncbi:hypothetical protein CSOJ01_03708 [Colletotrichum sojae]|uniref:Uncharacterized protein n=1 Tax=Colletotrichum sojae TaxID=2175907 RepID=A0A8H6N0K0_9PEZI|nr:hypothetical protein CSOJ01_03708 [Colletotrichum sojae]
MSIWPAANCDSEEGFLAACRPPPGWTIVRYGELESWKTKPSPALAHPPPQAEPKLGNAPPSLLQSPALTPTDCVSAVSSCHVPVLAPPNATLRTRQNGEPRGRGLGGPGSSSYDADESVE